MHASFALALVSMLVVTRAAVAGDPPATSPRTVVVFGDSITAGSALPVADRDRAWVRVVERESAGGLRLVNEGKGGRPTASVAEFEEMLRRQPRADVLVIALGTNDSRDLAAECVPKAVANLRQMIAKARDAYGKQLRIVLVGPPNLRKDSLGPTKPIADERDAKLRELGTGFETLAKESGCEFVSLYGVVPNDSLTKDGIHPDAEGNAAIAKAMTAALQPASK